MGTPNAPALNAIAAPGREDVAKEDDNDDDECENPPTAASCNNGEDTHGVQTDNNNDDNDANDNCKFGPGNCGFGSRYSRGVDDGANSDFDHDLFSGNCSGGEFQPRYYQGFNDGCIEAGNTRDVCESATDA